MNINANIPATQNEYWGFWGTMNNHAKAAWPIAMRAIAAATDQPLESIRIFLDSRHGRHFADNVNDQLFAGRSLEQAINAATQTWMGWTIGKIASRDYGIPRGLPYLTGFVIHCEIADLELAA
jgi:hypothetical protein